jgi:hypothetical protein
MKKRVILILLVMSLILTTGCAWTLHKRERDESNPDDEGTETRLRWKGPKAAIEHKF